MRNILIAAFAATFPYACFAAACKVVAVNDGDTLAALCADHEQVVKVRLAEIDAPEKAQPFGNRSKQSLSDLCFGKPAEIVPTAKDRYGRTVAHVSCAGVDANAEQVRRGMAWVYEKYATPNSRLYALQYEARSAHRGLWSELSSSPPWEWRKANR